MIILYVFNFISSFIHLLFSHFLLVKYDIGTKVRLIHTGDIATIIDYIDALSVLVELEDGDEIPVDLEDMTTEMKFVPKVTKKVVKDEEPETKTYLRITNTGVSVHFEPIYFVDESISHYKVTLLNDSEKIFVFAYEMKISTSVPKTKSNKIQSGQVYYLNDLTIEQLNDNPQVKLDLWQITTTGMDALLTRTIKLNAKKFFQASGKSPLSNKNGYTLSVFEKFKPPKVVVVQRPSSKADMPQSHEPFQEIAPEIAHYFDKEVKTYRSRLTGTGISVHFQPFHFEDGSISHYNVSLINDSEKSFHFSLALKSSTSVPKTKDGKIESGQVFPIMELFPELFNDSPKIHLQIWEVTAKGTGNPLSRTISLKAKKFVLSKEKAPLSNKPGYTLSFFENFTAQRKGDKSDLREAIVLKKKGKDSKVHYSSQSGIHPEEYAAFPLEIDLHIENLIKKASKKMTHAHILQIQEDHFNSYIYEAVRVGVDRVFIIHGVGEGILMKRIKAILDNIKEVKEYKNEYHFKYGYGATEVVFE